MMNPQKTERLIYALAISLAVIVLILVVLSSSFEVDTRVVYQGF